MINIFSKKTGTLVWKITDYSNKLADARTKEGMELVSPPWYTSQFGYKLQASLFLNGNGAGENTHLSLYIKILPGEYDALLRWPFAHSVAFTLFDQSEKVSIVTFIKLNETSKDDLNLQDKISCYLELIISCSFI